MAEGQPCPQTMSFSPLFLVIPYFFLISLTFSYFAIQSPILIYSKKTNKNKNRVWEAFVKMYFIEIFFNSVLFFLGLSN